MLLLFKICDVGLADNEKFFTERVAGIDRVRGKLVPVMVKE